MGTSYETILLRTFCETQKHFKFFVKEFLNKITNFLCKPQKSCGEQLVSQPTKLSVFFEFSRNKKHPIIAKKKEKKSLVKNFLRKCIRKFFLVEILSKLQFFYFLLTKCSFQSLYMFKFNFFQPYLIPF